MSKASSSFQAQLALLRSAAPMNRAVSGLLNIETAVKVREPAIPYFPIDYLFFNIYPSVGSVSCSVAKTLTV